MVFSPILLKAGAKANQAFGTWEFPCFEDFAGSIKKEEVMLGILAAEKSHADFGWFSKVPCRKTGGPIRFL